MGIRWIVRSATRRWWWYMVTNPRNFRRALPTSDAQFVSISAWRLSLPAKGAVLASSVTISLTIANLVLHRFSQGTYLIGSMLVLWLVLGIVELLDRSLKVSASNGSLWVRDWRSQTFLVVGIDQTVAPSWRKRRRVTYWRDGRLRYCWVPSKSPLA